MKKSFLLVFIFSFICSLSSFADDESESDTKVNENIATYLYNHILSQKMNNSIWEALDKIKKLSEKENDVKASYSLGIYYAKSIECVDSYEEKEAIKYFKRAIEKNYTPALIELAKYYQIGGFKSEYRNEKNKNIIVAFHFMMRAAELGNESAQNIIAKYYFMWKHFPFVKNVMSSYKITKFLKEASKKGNDEATFNLGVCRFIGFGVIENRDKAIELWKSISKESSAKNLAQDALNACYQNDLWRFQEYTPAPKKIFPQPQTNVNAFKYYLPNKKLVNPISISAELYRY